MCNQEPKGRLRMKFEAICNSKNEIRLGFIGGSITEDDKYRNHIISYLSLKYPKNSFIEIKGGVAGTPSYLGVHRIDRDVLNHDPDIVFIEFSVNDYSSEMNLFERSMEGMIRKTLKKNPNTLIAFIGTGAEGYLTDYYFKGSTPEMVISHAEIASYYNIPYINVGKAFSDYIVRSGDEIKKYLPDGVHPNSAGGKIYADEICNYLDNYDWNIDFKAEPKTVNNLENASLFMASDYAGDLWKISEDTMMGKNPDYIYSEQVGATLEFDFFGSSFGLYCTFDSNSGDLEFSIDGGEVETVSLWDTFCLSFDRVSCSILASELERKSHHIVMKISENKNEKSKGHSIRIGAFLFEKE